MNSSLTLPCSQATSLHSGRPNLPNSKGISTKYQADLTLARVPLAVVVRPEWPSSSASQSSSTRSIRCFQSRLLCRSHTSYRPIMEHVLGMIGILLPRNWGAFTCSCRAYRSNNSKRMRESMQEAGTLKLGTDCTASSSGSIGGRAARHRHDRSAIFAKGTTSRTADGVIGN